MATEHKCNIIMIGDCDVGKTSILKMYSGEVFSNSHMATSGVDYIKKTFTPENSSTGSKMTVNIWDTAGQERFKTLSMSFYQRAHGVILCFDVANANSFKNLKCWLEFIKRHAEENIAKILVGNKIDMEEDRKISEHDA